MAEKAVKLPCGATVKIVDVEREFNEREDRVKSKDVFTFEVSDSEQTFNSSGFGHTVELAVRRKAIPGLIRILTKAYRSK